MTSKVNEPGGESTIPAAVRPAHDAIVVLTDAFCREHLNDDYQALCRKLAGVLARKRPSPLSRGKREAWACGIVRVIGWVNFLDDPSQTPHLKVSAIDPAFGVSQATGQAKAKAIKDLIRLHPFDPEWTLPSLMEQNPMAWMIQVNGMVVDARSMPREIQEVAYQKGLIPFLPGEEPEACGTAVPAEAQEEDQAAGVGPEDMGPAAAADTACLVGEHHLRQGEYEKAVEAFTRAIENNPTVDAYEGRAQAYRALAERDEQKAQEQRSRM
jgi:tetratricopeptide (TPR) repeat protein